MGERVREVARGWLVAINELRRPAWTLTADNDAGLATELARELVASTTGLRLMVAGPDQDVLAVVAQARAAGMIDDEIAAHVTSTARRRIYCVHCKTTDSVEAPVGAVVNCSGCGRGVVIEAHLSRYSGAYLAVPAAAEGPS